MASLTSGLTLSEQFRHRELLQYDDLKDPNCTHCGEIYQESSSDIADLPVTPT